MRRAAKRDRSEPAIVAALREAGASVHRISDKDAPDLLVGFSGINLLMEVKNPPGDRGGTSKDGQHLLEGQAKWHREWKGAEVLVVHSPGEAVGAMMIAAAKVQR